MPDPTLILWIALGLVAAGTLVAVALLALLLRAPVQLLVRLSYFGFPEASASFRYGWGLLAGRVYWSDTELRVTEDTFQLRLVALGRYDLPTAPLVRLARWLIAQLPQGEGFDWRAWVRWETLDRVEAEARRLWAAWHATRDDEARKLLLRDTAVLVYVLLGAVAVAPRAYVSIGVDDPFALGTLFVTSAVLRHLLPDGELVVEPRWDGELVYADAEVQAQVVTGQILRVLLRYGVLSRVAWGWTRAGWSWWWYTRRAAEEPTGSQPTVRTME